jgi:nucleoside-specific outer membrane channel protein Tsx
MTVKSPSLARVIAALSLALLVAPAAARAEFGTTNFQLLQGWTFDKDAGDPNSTSDEKLTTLTINHFSTFAWGDNFLFADFLRGDGVNFGADENVYAEWHPRLFLNKAMGRGESKGFVKNWGLAGEVNQGGGFYAYLGGVSADFSIPGFAVAGLSVFYRYDKFAYHTWQVSPWWTVPFKLGPTDWVFTGFLDLTTNKDGDVDLMTQPELLLDVGKLAGSPGKLHAGVEWYLHAFNNGTSQTVSAPQAMIQWTAF